MDALDEAKAVFTDLKPDGADYVMADYIRINWNGQKYPDPARSRGRHFAEFLAREVGGGGVPGSSFYTGINSQGSYIRFNFAKKIITIKEACDKLVNNRG
ncbi:MAG: hypothetical protein LWX83_19695 [Anaerolineae bacterium]|nr:hypothetical protein [Anaerolineae bacterium]